MSDPGEGLAIRENSIPFTDEELHGTPETRNRKGCSMRFVSTLVFVAGLGAFTAPASAAFTLICIVTGFILLAMMVAATMNDHK